MNPVRETSCLLRTPEGLSSHRKQHDVNSSVCMEGVEALGGEKQLVLLGMERSVLIVISGEETCVCTQNGPFSVLIEHSRCDTHGLPYSV